MNRRPWPVVFVVLGALVQLAVWLVVRPDLTGPQWSGGNATGIWAGTEIGIAAVLGVMAPGRRELVATVLAGWTLQCLHFVVLGDHYDGTLWGVAVFGEVLFAAVAVGVALAADRLTRRG